MLRASRARGGWAEDCGSIPVIRRPLETQYRGPSAISCGDWLQTRGMASLSAIEAAPKSLGSEALLENLARAAREQTRNRALSQTRRA